MKRLVFCFLLLTGSLVSSQEIGSRFLTINESSLPQIIAVEESVFFMNTKKISFSQNLGVDPSNYWQPNSIIDALNQENIYAQRKNSKKQEITAESQGFFRPSPSESSIQFKVEGPDYFDNRRVKNSVYRDMSVPYFHYPFYYGNSNF